MFFRNFNVTSLHSIPVAVFFDPEKAYGLGYMEVLPWYYMEVWNYERFTRFGFAWKAPNFH